MRLDWILLSSLTLAGCGSVSIPDLPPGGTEFNFDFNLLTTGWVGDFADYPEGGEVFYELDGGFRNLPVPLNTSRSGFMLSGNNHSDDLYMYMKGQVNGLKPDTVYRAHFKVEFATEASQGCLGVGGAPGEGVIVKAGLSAVEPDRALDAFSDWRMSTVDKGNQAQSGADAIVLGNVANSRTDCSNFVYEFKTLGGGFALFTAQTDASGNFWLMVGTDSGFEATTTLYYTNVTVTLWEQ